MLVKNPASLPPLRADLDAHLSFLRAYIENQMSAPAEEMSAFFTKREQGYDEHMMRFAPCYPYTASHIPQDCARLLDLGCGTGLELDALDALCRAENRPFPDVVGVDLTPALVNQLMKKHPAHNICVKLGSYFTLPFGHEAFDCAVSVESLHHFSQEEKAPLFRNIHDALKPHGVFLLCDYFASCPEEADLCEEHYRSRQKPTSNAGSASPFVHIDRPQLPEKEAETLLSAGFSEVLFGATGAEGTLLLYAKK